MYTRCPECHTDFVVGATQLRAARGLVRCSRCGATFNALDDLHDDMPPPLAEQDGDTEPATPPPYRWADDDGADWWTIPPDLEQRPDAGPASQPEPVRPEAEDPGADETGDSPFAEAPRPRRPRRWLWGTLCVLALLALAAQAGFWNRDSWAESPQWRPVLAAVCGRLPVPCGLPPFVMLDRLRLENYTFSADPDRPGALSFSGVLVNRAPLPQAFPLLHISMENRWGDTVAVGAFGPADYLGEPVDTEDGIRPGQHIPIRLELKDPGSQASGFQFEFASPDR
ncbi:MAG TPA: DUF3426 domain-containing protein [Gammaproteobacteria bacterium]|nr:DUF3426 domain-containing protein [Gammaproteobacteria bacterium]